MYKNDTNIEKNNYFFYSILLAVDMEQREQGRMGSIVYWFQVLQKQLAQQPCILLVGVKVVGIWDLLL